MSSPKEEEETTDSENGYETSDGNTTDISSLHTGPEENWETQQDESDTEARNAKKSPHFKKEKTADKLGTPRSKRKKGRPKKLPRHKANPDIDIEGSEQGTDKAKARTQNAGTDKEEDQAGEADTNSTSDHQPKTDQMPHTDELRDLDGNPLPNDKQDDAEPNLGAKPRRKIDPLPDVEPSDDARDQEQTELQKLRHAIGLAKGTVTRTISRIDRGKYNRITLGKGHKDLDTALWNLGHLCTQYHKTQGISIPEQAENKKEYVVYEHRVKKAKDFVTEQLDFLNAKYGEGAAGGEDLGGEKPAPEPQVPPRIKLQNPKRRSAKRKLVLMTMTQSPPISQKDLKRLMRKSNNSRILNKNV